MSTQAFEGWCILELFGHRKLAGYVTQHEIAGAGFLRVDVPNQVSQFYAPAAVYGITPATEELVREFAKTLDPAPIMRWELPALPDPKVHEQAHQIQLLHDALRSVRAGFGHRLPPEVVKDIDALLSETYPPDEVNYDDCSR